MNWQPLPTVVAHADWSLHPGKRWAARAVLGDDGRYHVSGPRPAGIPAVWRAELREQAGATGIILAGFDFPIGLPQAYAARAGVADFLALLPRLGRGEWADFYRVAEEKEEIGVKRPFYPYRPGGTRRQHLLDGLGLADFGQLRRRCDRAQPHRRAAAPLFWTLGAQQVGKAAISGWREVLLPALNAGAALWPFSGTLQELWQPGRLILGEAYPAEFYAHLGLRFAPGSGKRDPAGRRAAAETLLAWAERLNLVLDEALAATIRDGFGEAAAGEDPFDAVVGLWGMLNLAVGERPWVEPDAPIIRRLEGWIMGQEVQTTVNG